jgi:nitric oxide reductase NorE protein
MTTSQARYMPGETGIWVFILGDVANFTLLFGVYLYYRALNVGLFAEHQQHLRLDLATVNTFILLTSSWFAALGLSYVRENRRTRFRWLMGLTVFCGVLFCILKTVEYVEKSRQGVGLLTNDFYTYYFILTGIHLLHVVVGLGILVYLTLRVKTAVTESDVKAVECGCAYWHMVDFLWILIFSLIYLMR